jgi:hypothetical protein
MSDLATWLLRVAIVAAFAWPWIHAELTEGTRETAP